MDHRRLVLLHGVLKDIGQAVGRPVAVGRFEGALDRGIEIAHRRAVQRRDEVQLGIVGETQTALDLGAHLVLGFALEAVPLVDGQHEARPLVST